MKSPRLLLLFLSIFALFAAAGCGGQDSAASISPGADAHSDANTSSGASSGSGGTGGSTGGFAGAVGGPDGSVGTGGASGGSGGADSSVGGTGGTSTATLVSIAVTPPVATLALGTSATLRATGRYSDNTTADLSSIAAWSSDTSSVATVSAGSVRAVGAGSAMITASVGAVSGTAKVTVTSATIVSIAVTPTSGTTGIGAGIQFTAVATLNDQTTQDVTASATWVSSTGSVASVSAAGFAKGVSAGTTTISAAVGSVSGQATLHVSGASLVSIAVTPTNPSLGVGVAQQFSAIATYSDKSIADVTQTAAWASSDPSTLTIAPAGLGATVAAGTSIVSAAVGGVTGTTTVTVTQATLTAITITPNPSAIAVNGTVQLVATGTYSDNTTADLTASVTWTSNSGSIASPSNAKGTAGLVTGLAAGSATIAATLGSVTSQATVNVTAAILVSIVITPAQPSTPKATTVAFTAKGTYSDNSVVDVTTGVSWSTDDTSIATISNATGSNGVATAVGLGTTGVHAALGGVTGSTTLTVTAATLASIAVTPAKPALAIGQKQLITATGTYSDQTTLDLTKSAVWSSSNTGVATVSNAAGAQGQVTATGAGTATLTATVGAISGSTTVTVSTPTLSQISVSPVNPTRPTGQKVQFTAMAIYTNNTSQNVTAQATWSTSSTAVATLGTTPQQAAVATTVAAGKTTIKATFGGFSGTTALTVTAAVITSITVTPIDPSLAPSIQANFRAVAIFSDNTSEDVTTLATWLSSATAVAGVSDANRTKGRVTTIAQGTAQISASYQGVVGSTTLTVTAASVVSISVSPAAPRVVPGASIQFTAEAIYSDNTSIDITARTTWTSSSPVVAGVSDTTATKGLAKAIAAGTATVQASYGGVTGSATLTVASATVMSIELTPFQPSVALGTPVRFAATAILSDGTSEPITGQATWTSSSSGIAAVSDAAASKGLTQTLGTGTSTISATWSGVTGTTLLTITGATLMTIQVTPFSPTIPVGFNTSMQATGIYSDSTTQDLTDLATWTSSNTTVAAVSDAVPSKGRLTPIAAGSTTIDATYQGVTGTDGVTVSSATLQSITISPLSATIAKHAIEPFTALGAFSDGSTLDITAYVTWLSSAPAIANVSNAAATNGQATGLGTGTATISATRSGVKGTATLTVN